MSNFVVSEVVGRPRTAKYPQLGPELQFENDPDVLRRAFQEQGLTLPDELREGEDPRAENPLTPEILGGGIWKD